MIPCHPLHLRQYANPVCIGDAVYVVEHDQRACCPSWVDDGCRCEVEEVDPYFPPLSGFSWLTIQIEQWGEYISLR